MASPAGVCEVTDMEYIAISTLIAIVGCFVALAGWLKNRDSKINDDAEWRGCVNGKLDSILGIQKHVDRIECDVRQLGERVAKTEASAASAHKRLDNMETTCANHHDCRSRRNE